MLHLSRSNRVEALLEALAGRLAAAPPASPFTPEVVVVGSPAMARWVNLHLARRAGVAANLDYPLPAAFVWRLARALLGDLPEADPLEREAMAWRVFALLPGLLGDPDFAEPRRYLADDPEGIKRWQLAERIADVLDRYQLYRPELIRAWDRGEEGAWDARLWRRLTAGLPGRHRVAVIGRLMARLAGPEAPPGLPERVSLFALPTLPPLVLEVFQALAAHVPVDLYLHAPSDAFWADLVSQKALARRRLEAPESAPLWEVGHPLLSSWGRQGQALQDLLLAPDLPMTEDEAFAEPPGDTLLGRLQGDLLALRPVPGPHERAPAAADGSLEVHVCHGPLRECQVLHDRLLALLDRDPGLRPEEVLVMVPDMATYAPYIEAVFAQDGERERPFIPWNLSDTAARDEHPLVGVFLQLLDLPVSRFSHSEVLSYLDLPEVAARFDLDPEGVARVREWLAEANVRWGLDGGHKARLGLPATPGNTWAQAEERLFAGYALGGVESFAGIAPIPGVEGAEAAVLGRFWRLLAGLAEAAADLAAARPAGAWQERLNRLLGDFFGEGDDEDGRLQKVRDAVADLGEQAAAVDEPLSRALVRRWLEERLGLEGRRGRYFSGGVTFCGMRPMRSLPFRVVCVLGLQDPAFPRRDRPVTFDRMARDWRPGDPRPGDEDRYLFLETLLCARERLVLTYTGRDPRSNEPRQPSVLVAELLDTLDQYCRPPEGEGGALSAAVTTVHPLQPFSPRAFAGDGAGYDGDWCRVARALAAPGAGPAGERDWPGARLEEAPDGGRPETLDQLARFLAHPVRAFVTGRLQVRFAEEETPEDEEPFALDALAAFRLRERLVADRLGGRGPDPGRLAAEGALPHGAFARLALEEADQRAAPLAERLAPLSGLAPETLHLEVPVAGAGGPPLTAGLPGYYPGLGLWRWRPGRLRGEDVLGLWLAHLARCAAGAGGDAEARLDGEGETFVIAGGRPPEAAAAALGRYLEWYREGMHRPLAVAPRATYAYARARVEGRRDPLKAAQGEWNGNDYNHVPGDRHDPYIALVMRGVEGTPLAHPEFPELATALYAEALGAGAWQ